VHSVAHGVIRLEQLAPSYGAERRRLRVLKYRGRKYRGGFHDFVIGSNVELRFDIAPNLPSAQVDANQIELAILNLAINSRDAMPNGGTIAIGVGQGTSTGRGQMQQGRYLWIKVSDTGSGMDAKTLQMAVEPFFSTKPLGKGTGLGLSMVHGLVSQLGGGLELTSTLGAGTSATLWLPIAATRAAATAPVESAPVASTSTGRILVVDDDPLIAMNTVDMLEDLGHTVIRANSGRRALELLETEPAVDVLMTDHAMPGMTGLELAEIARRKWPNSRPRPGLAGRGGSAARQPRSPGKDKSGGSLGVK
jgi:CheY-like chemotaxis protein